MFERFIEFFWPRLTPFTATQRTAMTARDQQNDTCIRSLKPKKQATVALDEARRLSDAENERRRSADQKATTYLAFVAAILPLILTVTTAFWDKKAGDVPLWLNISLLIIAILYTLRAGKWAFEVLKVKASHRLGFSDFDKAWKQVEPTIHLTQSILQTIRLNETGTNEKVSGIKMAHAFLFRAFVAFFFLLVVNILWPVSEFMRPPNDPWFASSQTALRAVNEVDKLHRTVIEKGTTRQSLATWCTEHRLGKLSVITVKPSGSPSSSLPLPAKASPRGAAPNAKINIRCGNRVIAAAYVWIMPTGQFARIDPMSLIYRGELSEFGLVANKSEIQKHWPHPIDTAGYSSLPHVLASEEYVIRVANEKPMALVHVEYRNDILRFGPDFAHEK
jgi:hypothetical protein